MEEGPNAQDPATHVRGLDGILGSYLWPGPALAIVAIWRANSWIDFFLIEPLSLSFSHSLSNKFCYQEAELLTEQPVLHSASTWDASTTGRAEAFSTIGTPYHHLRNSEKS